MFFFVRNCSQGPKITQPLVLHMPCVSNSLFCPCAFELDCSQRKLQEFFAGGGFRASSIMLVQPRFSPHPLLGDRQAAGPSAAPPAAGPGAGRSGGTPPRWGWGRDRRRAARRGTPAAGSPGRSQAASPPGPGPMVVPVHCPPPQQITSQKLNI